MSDGGKRQRETVGRSVTEPCTTTLLGTGIVWLAWLRGAYRNLALVGSKRSRFTPRRAVGYWFMPFVNLVRGYQVMKDLWLRSESMNDRHASECRVLQELDVDPHRVRVRLHADPLIGAVHPTHVVLSDRHSSEPQHVGSEPGVMA